MSLKRTGVLVVGLVLVGGGIAGARLLGRRASGIETAPVERGDFREVVEATAKLEAAVAFEIGPPSVQDMWDYNLTWLIPEGSRVKLDDVVARFDTTELDERLVEHQAARETTIQEREKEERNLEIALKELNLDLVKAQGELQRVELDLEVPEGVASSHDIQQARLKRNLAAQRVAFLGEKITFEKALVRSKLELLDVKRAFAEGKIKYNEEAKAKFEVKAPVAGTVVYIPKRNGDRWEVGENVWMMAKLLEVADVTTLRVEANVLEADAARIAAGQPAEVRVDAIPGMVLASEVKEIGAMVHERSLQDPSKVFDVYLPLEGADLELLKPGMSVHVVIEIARHPGSLKVPIEAVRRGPDGPYVEVAGEGGATSARPVVLGPRDRTRVVVSQGLSEGESVVVRRPEARS
jgi:HlyD family secretion protein